MQHFFDWYLKGYEDKDSYEVALLTGKLRVQESGSQIFIDFGGYEHLFRMRFR